ncbi:hypothetical protein [Variovorax sp. UC122_21]|uniref:hypothetical protein n=1 Tax=Variovorax sp. UC122_21 TaxID=3374554 RepID=UPI0037583125
MPTHHSTPDHRDDQVRIGVGIAEEAGGQRQHEQRAAQRSQHHRERMRDAAQRREAQQVGVAREGGTEVVAPREQRERREGQHQGRAGPREPQPQRQRQVEALAEAVRLRTGRGACDRETGLEAKRFQGAPRDGLR